MVTWPFDLIRKFVSSFASEQSEVFLFFQRIIIAMLLDEMLNDEDATRCPWEADFLLCTSSARKGGCTASGGRKAIGR